MPRLFHTLVVFGAGLSLSGCGGRAVGIEESDDPGDDGAGGAPSGGKGGGITFTGGRASGNGGARGSGGAPGAGGAPFDPSLSAQWDCTKQLGVCSSNGTPAMAFFLEEPCPTDPTRPKSTADCAPDEWFECYLAVLAMTPLVVNCQCAPVAADPNCATCSDVPGYDTRAEPASCVGRTKFCGCAYTGILR